MAERSSAQKRQAAACLQAAKRGFTGSVERCEAERSSAS